jgi:hypothetical protein
MNLAIIGTRPHPSGGVPPDRWRTAPEAGGQGETSPTKLTISNICIGKNFICNNHVHILLL